MKIQKAGDSEIFDNFAKIMQGFKKESNWASQTFDAVSSGNKTLIDSLKEAGKRMEDFINELIEQGKSYEEVANITGKNVDEVEKLVKPTLPSSSVPSPTQTVTNTLNSAAQTVLQNGRELVQSLKKQDLENMSKEELITLYKQMEKSRNGMKGQIATLKKHLQEAQQNSTISVESQRSLQETIRNSEQLLKMSDQQIAELGKRVSDLSSQLDESATALKTTQQELKSYKDALEVAQATIRELETQNIKLSEEATKKLEEALEKTETGSYYKTLSESLKETDGEDTIATRIADAASAEAFEEASQTFLKIKQQYPQASEVVDEATRESSSLGYRKAVNAISDEPTSIKTENLPSYTGSRTEPVPEPTTRIPDPKPSTYDEEKTVHVPDSKISPQTESPDSTGPITPAKTPSSSNPESPQTVPTSKVDPATKDPKAKPTPQQSGAGVSKSDSISGENSTKIPGSMNSTSPAALSNKKSLIRELILKNSPKILETGGKGIKGALKFGALILIGGATVAYILSRWSTEDPTARRITRNIQVEESELIAKLKQLQFQSGSKGEMTTDDLIGKLNLSFRSLPAISNPNSSAEEKNKALRELDNLMSGIENYLRNKDLLRNDLIASDELFDSAIQDLENLLASPDIEQIKNKIVTGLEEQEQSERGITEPIGKPVPDFQIPENNMPGKPQTSPGGNHIPQIVNVLGQQIDIGKESKGFRSAAPAIISKVINSPEGLAFIDPDNQWGGWLPKTSNVIADYHSALQFLYLNKISNRHDLRKFIRQNLSKMSRGKLSGWKKAVNYYSKNPEYFAKSINNQKPEQKISKNKEVLKKQADTFSKEFYQDAVKDLEDQYAKSYYAGLKGMYDEKPKHTDADFQKLYKVHKEDGADLIDQAHPYTIDLADAMGNGGIVENLIEQQRHNTGVAKSMPSGNFRGKHAWVMENLVKLADQTDEKGWKEVVVLIDKALDELSKL